MEPALRTAGFADYAHQGLPFYGGNVTYRIPFESDGGEVVVQTSLYRVPVIKAAVDGKAAGHIVTSPYTVNPGRLEAGAHLLELQCLQQGCEAELMYMEYEMIRKGTLFRIRSENQIRGKAERTEMCSVQDGIYARMVKLQTQSRNWTME